MNKRKKNEKHVIFAMEYCRLCPLSPSSTPFESEQYIQYSMHELIEICVLYFQTYDFPCGTLILNK